MINIYVNFGYAPFVSKTITHLGLLVDPGDF